MASLRTESEPTAAPPEPPHAALNPGGLPRAAFGDVLTAAGVHRRDERETALLILVALGERQFVRRGGSWRNATEALAARNAPWTHRRIIAREGSGPALRTVRRVLGKLRSAGVVATIVRRRQRADSEFRVVGARTATHTSTACLEGFDAADPWAGYDALGRCLNCSVSLRGPGEMTPFGAPGPAWRGFALWGFELADPPDSAWKVADPPSGGLFAPPARVKVADPPDKVADPPREVADPPDKVADPPDSYGGGEDGGSDGGRGRRGNSRSPPNPLASEGERLRRAGLPKMRSLGRRTARTTRRPRCDSRGGVADALGAQLAGFGPRGRVRTLRRRAGGAQGAGSVVSPLRPPHPEVTNRYSSDQQGEFA